LFLAQQSLSTDPAAVDGFSRPRSVGTRPLTRCSAAAYQDRQSSSTTRADRGVWIYRFSADLAGRLTDLPQHSQHRLEGTGPAVRPLLSASMARRPLLRQRRLLTNSLPPCGQSANRLHAQPGDRTCLADWREKVNKFNVTSAKISTTPHDARWPPRRCGDARWRLGRQVELELLHQKLPVGVAAARPVLGLCRNNPG
jgi:hypothetical protein